MFYSGFESDAAYFDLIAHSADSKDRKQLRQVSATYRSLAKNGEPRFVSRGLHWSNRAAKCRELSEQFKNPVCRTHLLRLAESYEMLAGACGEQPTLRKPALAVDLAALSRSPA
jgi:hypothetical protein